MIAHGLGLVSANVVGSVLSALGLLLAVVSGTVDRTTRRRMTVRSAADRDRAVDPKPRPAAVPA